MNKLDYVLLLARCGASLQQIRTAQNRLSSLRRIRIRRHTRQQLLDVIRTLNTSGRPQELLPGMVVRARVRRINLDGSVVVEVGRGGPLAVLPKEERVPTSRRLGQLRRDDTLWLAVKRLVYHEKGVQYEMSARDSQIPLELLRRQNPKLHGRVTLTVLERVPGAHCVVAIQPVGEPERIDYRALVAGPSDQHLRAVSKQLRGEQLILRIIRRPVHQLGGEAVNG